MKKTRSLINELPSRLGKEVMIKGRVISTREVGAVRFADLLDRSGRIQMVLDENIPLPPLQSIITCCGEVEQSEKAFSGYEIRARTISVIASPKGFNIFNPEEITSPLKEGGPSLERQLDSRHLALRSITQQSIIKITSEVLGAISAFLRREDFIEIKTPKLVNSGAEGGAGMFEVKYFEKLMYLSQSPQLYKQTLAASPLERFFEIAPVFRFEKHATSRHLNEFTGIDVEYAYPDDLEEIINLEVDLLFFISEHIRQTCRHELDLLGASLPVIDNVPLLSLDEARELLTGEKPSRTRPATELSPAEEAELCRWAFEEHGSDAVAVHSYPAATRPFYIMPYPENPRRSMSFDLLVRGVELSSGGIRIHDFDLLEYNMKRKGLKIDDFGFYKEVFKHACPPHGGFGIGLERLVGKLLGFKNIRDSCLFVRDRLRVTP